MTLIGELSLWVAMLLAVWSVLVIIAGEKLQRPDLRESGDRAVRATAVMLILSCVGLFAAILGDDLSLAYVAAHSATNLPVIYSLSAFLSGEPGRLLATALILSVCGALAGAARIPRAISALVVVGLLARLGIFENPFRRLDWIPADGLSLQPALQNPGVETYLALQVCGCACSIFAGACALAGVIGDGARAEERRNAQKPVFIALVLMSCAILLGMWSAYAELGWPDAWITQPVKSGSLFLWIGILFLGTPASWFAGMSRSRALAGVLSAAVMLLGIFCLYRAVPAITPLNLDLVHSAKVRAAAALPFMIPGTAIIIAAAASNQLRTRTALVGVGAIVLGGLLLESQQNSGVTSLSFPAASAPVVAMLDSRGRMRLELLSVSEYDELNREVTAFLISATRNADPPRLIVPEERRLIDGRGAPTSAAFGVPGIAASLREDIYVRVVPGRNPATPRIEVFLKKFMWLAWAGLLLIFVGAAILAGPLLRTGASRVEPS